MIHYKKLATSLCLLIVQLVTSQTYELVYNVNFKPKVNDSTTINENYIFRYDIEKKRSVFIFSQDDNLNAIIHKDFNKSNFTKYESILNNYYHTNFVFNKSNWKLLADKKEILGYQCEKASINFGGRHWEAWFTTDIPLQDGPYKFYGLPGLILEIKSLDNDYSFTATSLEKTNNEIRSDFTSFLLDSKEKEKAFKEKIIKDPAFQYREMTQRLKSNDMTMSASYNGKEISNKDMEKSIIDDFQKWTENHNNPLEKDDIWIK